MSAPITRSCKLFIACVTVCVAGNYASLSAQDMPKMERPKLFQELVSCRAIVDQQERLACYDNKVEEIDTAEKNDELFLADKAEINKAKRGLFGFSLPKIRLFQGGDDENKFDELETTIKSVRKVGYGTWILTLEEGGTWRQNDTRSLVMSPRVGQKVTVKEAALGSYKISVNGQPAIKFQRIE